MMMTSRLVICGYVGSEYSFNLGKSYVTSGYAQPGWVTRSDDVNLIHNRQLNTDSGTYVISGQSAIMGIVALSWPDPDQVLLGVQYGPTGTEYTGTLDMYGIKLDIATGSLVKPLTSKVVLSLQ